MKKKVTLVDLSRPDKARSKRAVQRGIKKRGKNVNSKEMKDRKKRLDEWRKWWS